MPMVDHREHDKPPLLALKPAPRLVAVLSLIGLGVAHLVRPDWAIDGVFLGLLAFAAFVWLFDVESVELQGVKARRREIARVKAALDESPPSDARVVPSPVPTPAQLGPAGSTPTPPAASTSTVHTRSHDLDVPTNAFERLFWATEQIRVELIMLAGNAGRLKRIAPWSEYRIPELVSYLRSANVLPEPLIQAISTVLAMRNSAAHTQVVDPAADLALDALQTLRSIHRDYVRVRHSDVVLFRDQSLTSPHDRRGVMVVQVDEAGTVQEPQVFPRSTEFHDGRFVTWSWDMERVSQDEAWYRDPDTGRVKMAWGAAATFAGREYPEQWGLEYRLPHPDLGLS
jgi:hypothetical protein